ncbi:hypothetical protein [Ramlibacter humi]|uniref:Uncharacterized protein n=1 Tax=Ramlibacter humi TaxID=2530451 RepID=A0A4Z0BD45_9BURK|nr:hypothetical protein [Ramlibacter humi]TFY96700.1 hypothetical protein EZ216_20170 [Ramlibacter humi]
MKSAPLLMAALLATAGTAAFAQSSSGEKLPSDNRAAQNSDGRSVGQVLRDDAHKVGDATKRLFHRGKGDAKQAKNDAKSKDARHENTRAMGAGRADDQAANDTSRQQRMDDAYADYKRKADQH